MPLNREQFLARRRKPSPVEVPGWGETILLRPLSVAALGDFMGRREKLTAYELYPLLVVLSACDEAGDLLFADEDLPALGQVAFDVLKAIGEEIMKLNKMKEEPPESEGGPKNSPTAPPASAPSRLLSGSE